MGLKKNEKDDLIHVLVIIVQKCNSKKAASTDDY